MFFLLGSVLKAGGFRRGGTKRRSGRNKRWSRSAQTLFASWAVIGQLGGISLMVAEFMEPKFARAGITGIPGAAGPGQSGDPVSDGLGAFAIGAASTTGTSRYATALGFGAKASGHNSQAWGTNALAFKENSIAIGLESNATATNSVALGPASQALGINATALGSNSSAKDDRTTAVGSGSSAASNASSAFGYLATSSGYRSQTFGAYSNATQIHRLHLVTPLRLLAIGH